MTKSVARYPRQAFINFTDDKGCFFHGLFGNIYSNAEAGETSFIWR
jgi:hypothetical protein